MRLIQFFRAVNLFEAAKDRYTQMFTNLIPMFKEIQKDEEYEVSFNREIDWAMRTLKKQDKIIWYLRFVKLELMKAETKPYGAQNIEELDAMMKADALKHPDNQIDWKTSAEKFGVAYRKGLKQLSGKMNITPQQADMLVAVATSRRFKGQMEHFMSLNMAALEEYVFTNQSPDQILADWTPIEDAWKQKRKHTVPLDREGVDTIIKYPDGSEWVNLNKEYCTDEGDAMGHCGNSADPKEGDTVLSYRTIEEEDGEQLWKPYLTFILDKNGLLGETKGRFNERPDQEHHDVIVDLLRQDFVKGIKGGGYEPQNNFHFEDLSQEVQDKLVEEKPGLASIGFDYKKRGMTKELLSRMEALWEETGVEFPEFKDDMFWELYMAGLENFLEQYGGDQAPWVAKILDGREHLDIDLGGHAYYQDEIFGGLSTDVQHSVGKWLIENYESEVEEWKEENDTHYDGTDASDTIKIAKEYEIEEITDALYRAEMTGHEYGAESEMSESLSSWLKELPNNMDWDLSLKPDTPYEEEDAEYRKLGFPVEVMIDILDNYLGSLEYNGGIAGIAEIKELEAPYHGWQGFDEEGAKERAVEELHETGVLTNETP